MGFRNRIKSKRKPKKYDYSRNQMKLSDTNYLEDIPVVQTVQNTPSETIVKYISQSGLATTYIYDVPSGKTLFITDVTVQGTGEFNVVDSALSAYFLFLESIQFKTPLEVPSGYRVRVFTGAGDSINAEFIGYLI